MTPEEIKINNKLIQEFHTGKPKEKDKYRGVFYEEDWGWLMSVVEKIESIEDYHHGYFQVHISGNSCSIQGTNLYKAIKPGSTYKYVYMSDPNAIFPTKLESTYCNVVQFVKWFNENLKQ